jgi:CTP:molybdopterin cytidylyltransferase MocA
VVLAAGGGTRFAGAHHKLLTPLQERPLVLWAVDAAVEAHLDEVIVVTGAVDLAHLLRHHDVTVVHADDWQDGQARSLQAGIAAAAERGHDAVVVGLGDQPFVDPVAWRDVAATTATPVAAASFGGRLRPPVRIGRDAWPLLPTDGDEGARVLLRSRPELVTAVPCNGDPRDIDTVEDLQQWS